MTREQDTSKLWGGRFTEATDSFVQRFTASVDFDRRMAEQDIEGSLAHAEMLQATGVLTQTELEEIRSGLTQVQRESVDGSTKHEKRPQELIGQGFRQRIRIECGPPVFGGKERPVLGRVMQNFEIRITP